MRKRKTLGHLEIVYWYDACTHHGWRDKSEQYELEKCCSVGWIIQDDKNVLVVAPNRHDEDRIGDPTAIPKGWVYKRVVLRRR